MPGTLVMVLAGGAASLVAPACLVPGTALGSVLGPGVLVETGAIVLDSVGRAGGGSTGTRRDAGVAAGTNLAAEDEEGQ